MPDVHAGKGCVIGFTGNLGEKVIPNIVGVDIDGNKNNPTLFKELLNAAIIDCKQRQGKSITCFCDKEDLDSLVDCGFNCVGNYLCYKTII